MIMTIIMVCDRCFKQWMSGDIWCKCEESMKSYKASPSHKIRKNVKLSQEYTTNDQTRMFPLESD